MLINVAYVVHVTNNANNNSLPSRRTNILYRLYLLDGRCCVLSAGRCWMASSSDVLLIVQPHLGPRWISRRSSNTPRPGGCRPALAVTPATTGHQDFSGNAGDRPTEERASRTTARTVFHCRLPTGFERTADGHVPRRRSDVRRSESDDDESDVIILS